MIISAATVFQYYGHDRKATEQFLRKDRNAAVMTSLILEERFQMIIKTMESYGNRLRMMEAVANRNEKKAREQLAGLKKELDDAESAAITDRQGTLWVGYPPAPEVQGKNFNRRDWYKGVSRKWKPYVSEVMPTANGEKNPLVVVSVPLTDNQGGVHGVLAIILRTARLGETIGRIPLDPGSFLSVTDQKGRLIYSSRRNPGKEIIPYPFYFMIDKPIPEGSQSVAVFEHSLDGRKNYVSYATVADKGWIIFIERSRRAIFLEERTHLIQLAAISILLFLVIFASLLYFRKRVLTQQVREQLQTHEELQASEMRFKELFDNMSTGVAIFRAVNDGEDFEIIDMNEAGQKCARLYTDFIGKTLCDVFPMVKETGIFEFFQEVWKTGRPVYHPTIFYHDGRLSVWTESHLYKMPSGEIVDIVNDVTERMKTEEMIFRQGRLLTAINSVFYEALMASGEEDVAKTCLDVAQDITGSKFGMIGEITPDGLFSTTAMSDPGWEACRIPEMQAVRMIMDMTIRGIWGQVILQDRPLIVNDPASYPDRVGLPEGHPPIASFLGVPLRERDKVVGMIAVANNESGYTEDHQHDLEALSVAFVEAMRRKSAEIKLQRMNVELDQQVSQRTALLTAANRELEAFSYSVSHDLRAPLRSINGFSRAVLDEYADKLDEAGKSYLERIHKATQRMDVLIDDLLNLSKVTRSEFQSDAVDLSRIFRALLKDRQKNDPDRVVDAIVADGIVVQADTRLMRIALDNLLENAWKFTSREALARIEFGSEVNDGRVFYFIRDNGVGFNETYSGKMFGAFQRFHSAADFPGTGIGLAIVQRIIHRHGGHVWAEGEVGKGATFYFTLA